MDQAMKHWKILQQLDPPIRNRIELFIVLKGEDKQSVLFSTNDDLVYWYGTKLIPVQVPSLMEVAHSRGCLVLLTKMGQLYETGKRTLDRLALGTGDEPDVISPTLIECNQKFVSVRCGLIHKVALADDGKLYAWGSIFKGQFAHLDKPHLYSPECIDSGTVLVEIYCGNYHTVGRTDRDTIRVWGCDSQHCNRSNANKDFVHLKFKVKSVATSHTNIMVLSYDGEVYVTDIARQSRFPVSHGFNKIPNLPPIDQIISHFNHILTIAMTVDRICYVWKNLNESPLVSDPEKLPPEFATFDSVLSHYGYGSSQSVSIQDYHDSKSARLAYRMARMLSNPTASDVHFVLGSDTIYAHRSVLVNSSPYFAQKFSEIWLPISDDLEDSIIQIPIFDHSYRTFHALIRYLYTDSLPEMIDPTFLVDLFELANLYQEPELEQHCLAQMLTHLNTDNYLIFYQLAQQFELVEFEQKLAKFITSRYLQETSDPFALAKDDDGPSNAQTDL